MDRDIPGGDDRHLLARLVGIRPGAGYNLGQDPDQAGEAGMDERRDPQAAAFAALIVIALAGLLPLRATAQGHPQEVLDLLAGYDALAMKVRPLQDRVVAAASSGDGSAGFKAEGVPVRAKAAADTASTDTAAEQRVSERLRHKDRAVPTGDDYARVRARLAALEDKLRAERARISSPGFGVPPNRVDDDSGAVRFGDARRGARPPSSSAEGRPGAVDAEALADAQKTFAALQREIAGLEREVETLERR